VLERLVHVVCVAVAGAVDEQLLRAGHGDSRDARRGLPPLFLFSAGPSTACNAGKAGRMRVGLDRQCGLTPWCAGAQNCMMPAATPGWRL
jgi:hypothetical protein